MKRTVSISSSLLNSASEDVKANSKRTISIPSLLLASVSAIIGSGWLFSAYYTAQLAGPGALLAWLLGGIGIIIVAFVFAELSAMIPIVGSSARIPLYTHGTIVSFMFSWIIWLSYAAIVSAEVQAVIQYVSYFFPKLVYHTGALTHEGYLLAIILMLIISSINIFSLRWLMRLNSFLTIIKIIVPILISGVVLVVYFNPHREIHPLNSTFLPFGWHGVFAALTTGGIVFAFNGFKQACELAGEAEHPARALPIAVVGSVVLSFIVYLLLQSTLLTSLTHDNLVNGWSKLTLFGANSPLAAILYQDHFNWLMPLLYLCAVIGPLAAALMYLSSASRALYGKSKNGYLPEFFQTVNVHGNPVYAIIANVVLGMCFFAPLPGWNSMVAFLTSLMGVTYAIAPVNLLALYKQVPEYSRPFRLPFPRIWSFVAFYICTMLIYWSGWNIISKLGIAFLTGIIVLFIYRFTSRRARHMQLNWKQSIWLWPYFIGITIISYLGNYGDGRNILPFGWDFLVLAIFSWIILMLAEKFVLPREETLAFLNELKAQHEGFGDQ